MMVTGQTPFGNCSALDCFLKKTRNEMPAPRELARDLSERVDWAIRRAMSPNAEQRPETCREFVEDLYGRTTRPSQIERAPGEGEVWYLVYQDELGQPHTVKGGTEGIRRALRDGLLGDTSTMTACRQKNGPFVGLQTFPEFRDLLIAPEAMPTMKPQAPARQVTRLPTPPSTLAPPPLPKEEARRAPSPPVNRPGQPAWRQSTVASRTPSPTDDRLPGLPKIVGRSITFDVVLWVMVLVASLAVALLVFHFFPPP